MRTNYPNLRRRCPGSAFLKRFVAPFAPLVLAFTAFSFAQEPQPQLPNVYIDTTWNPPTGGTTWAAHTAAQLTSALNSSQPGDIIVLDAGATYTGNFRLPPKTNPNNQWIYIMSSGIANLPVGTRVGPSSVQYMATIVTPNVAPTFQLNGGTNHLRLAGLEITSASTQGCNLSHTPPINCFSYFLVGSQPNPTPLPDSITIDRCYIHGSPTIDVETAVQATASSYAVIDSYISDIHMTGFDTQAVASYWSPGPIKITNNFLSAAGENIMFGGSGGPNNPYVPSDIQVQYNDLYKPLSWATQGTGGTIPPNNQWVEKDAFEVKSGQRVLFDSNVIQNVWKAGQNGFAIVLTVRSSQSGDIAVVNDITITNNVLNNVVSGVNTLAQDDQCHNPQYPQYMGCGNAGSQDRWNIANNTVQFYDPTIPGGFRNLMMAVSGGYDHVNNVVGVLRDVVFQSNAYSYYNQNQPACWSSIYFSCNGTKPPWTEMTNNIWILNNTLCRQPTGDWGFKGQNALDEYMGYPGGQYADTVRFQGNQMAVDGDSCYTWPVGNTCF